MAAIKERYSSAVHAASLVVDPRSTMGNVDVLTAMGWTDRALTTGKRWARTRPGEEPAQENIRPAPLAVALARLFAGDNGAAHVLTRVMAQMVYARSYVLRVKISRHGAFDMARACLAWSRNGTCQACGGHGYDLMPGAPMLSDHQCETCKGTGKVLFEPQFRREHLDLARWLVAQLEREIERPWAEAAKALNTEMEL